MQKLKRLIIHSSLLSLVIVFGLGGAAYAIQDSHSGSDSNSGTSTTTETEHATSTEQTTATNKAEAERQHQAELRQKAETELEAKKQERKEQKTQNTAERQKRCESHKQGLNKKFTNIAANSQKAQDRIDSIFVKVKSYKEAKNLDVTNYDTLVAAAASAQTDSQTAINTLKTITPTIDCNNTSTASDVATYKQAAINARDKLKAYRSAVKDLIKAVKAAKPAEGVNQ